MAVSEDSTMPKITPPATVEQWASVDFEPWQRTPCERPLLPSQDQWKSCQIVVHIAWEMLHKSKSELMKLIDGMDEEEGLTMKDGFISTIDRFKGMLAILEGAEARIVCAGSALEVEEDQS